MLGLKLNHVNKRGPWDAHLYTLGLGHEISIPNPKVNDIHINFVLRCTLPHQICPAITNGYPAMPLHCPSDRSLPVWDDIFTPAISSPRGENIVTIFSPPLWYFHPLTISNGKSFCSQISLNFIMCIYNKEAFLYFLWLFTEFCSSQTVDTIH